jgi:hypothetical protein
MRRAIVSFSVIALLLMALDRPAMAQPVTPPFFNNAGVVGFEPQISTVFTGQFIGQQAVVSHDLKYVTINSQVSSQRLIALNSFAFQNPTPMGFVGGTVQTPTVGTTAIGAGRVQNRNNSNHPNPATILDRQGMTLLAALP